MSALFLLLMGIIAWNAPRTRPLAPPQFVHVTQAGDQVFPVGVPAGEPPRIPRDPTARLNFLRDHSVDGNRASPDAECEVFVRISTHHWLRLHESAARLTRAQAAGSPGGRTFRLAGADVLDDDDGDGDPLDERELRPSGPGADVEAICRP